MGSTWQLEHHPTQALATIITRNSLVLCYWQSATRTTDLPMLTWGLQADGLMVCLKYTMVVLIKSLLFTTIHAMLQVRPVYSLYVQ